MNNYVLVRVVGRNVNNYIKWLVKQKINVTKLKIIRHNELNILVDYQYFDILTKYSKTYKVTIIKKYGCLKIFDMIISNGVILICFIIAICFLYYLSGYIFTVDIVYNDREVIDYLSKELAKYGIKKFGRKQNYDYISGVKNEILTNNKDTLEWLEIEESGTKYIVKLVERKKDIKNSEHKYQSIVAKKDAIINSIKSYSGERVRLVNDYVKHGDVIISGILTKTDGTLVYDKAKGMVTGEVWYQVQIDYPLLYYEEKMTGRSRETIGLYFINKEVLAFPYRKYKHFDLNSKVLFEDIFIPFSIVKEKLYETVVKEEIYTVEQAVIKAKEVAIKNLKDRNSAIIEVKDIQVLDKEFRPSMIKLNLFISAIEDITEIVEVVPQQEKVEN